MALCCKTRATYTSSPGNVWQTGDKSMPSNLTPLCRNVYIWNGISIKKGENKTFLRHRWYNFICHHLLHPNSLSVSHHPFTLLSRVARVSHFPCLHTGHNIDQGKNIKYILKQLPFTCGPSERSKYLLIASTYPISLFVKSYILSPSTVLCLAGFCLFSTYWCIVRASCIFNSNSQPGFHLSRVSVITPFPDYALHPPFKLPILQSVLMKLQVSVVPLPVRVNIYIQDLW